MKSESYSHAIYGMEKKAEMEIKNTELYVSHITACIHFPQVNLPRIKYLL